MNGSTTDITARPASSASTALPPSCRTFTPVRAASGCRAVTMPAFDRTSVFRTRTRDSLTPCHLPLSLYTTLPELTHTHIRSATGLCHEVLASVRKTSHERATTMTHPMFDLSGRM